jgi:hypothetical protein
MDENGRPLISAWVQKYPEMPRWDAFQATILRHNRMHCDHGWDIDLDDGSTNYDIYNNLCISGGLKTREGYYRIVRNNIIFKHFTCNVPYPKPTYDIFESNIIWGRGYKSSFATRWGGVRNKTFFHNPKAKKVEPAIAAQSQTLDDEDSLYGNAQFIDPQNGDFNVAGQSPALNVGFKNFPMTGFGVTSPRLKAMASEPPIHLPSEVSPNIVIKHEEMKCQGATIKILETESELTATGMFDKKGVLLISVPQQSPLCAFGFKSDDVILELTGHPISSDTQLCQLFKTLKPGRHKARVWRNQESIDLSFEVE